jgi:hypothetical protein
LFAENKLNDEQFKELSIDVGTRIMSIYFLQQVKDGECIMIAIYVLSFNLFSSGGFRGETLGAITPIPKNIFVFPQQKRSKNEPITRFFDSIAPIPIEAPPLTKILDPPLLLRLDKG